MNDKTSGPNYEAMYNNVCEDYMSLQMRHNDLLEKQEAMEMELVKLRAQMEVVNLIFGGRK